MRSSGGKEVYKLTTQIQQEEEPFPYKCLADTSHIQDQTDFSEINSVDTRLLPRGLCDN
jgi:hypothetical protein